MFKNLKSYLALIVAIFQLFILTTNVSAQEGVEASIDTSHLVIGQQTHLTLTFRYPEGARTGWPQWRDTLTNHIEVIKQSKIDTLPSINGLIGLQQTLTLSVFDSGLYIIPPIQVGYMRENDTAPTFFVSKPIALKVNTVSVDTTKAFLDIKGLVKAPVTLKEVAIGIVEVVTAVSLLLLIIWYIRKRLRKEPIIPTRPKVVLPPDVEAIKLFETLRLKKLWQNGEVKLYYTELTDIIRHYLDRRFNIQAAEMTSSEIMTEVNRLKLNKQTASLLEVVFELADLAKFAKLEPTPLENDTALNYSIDFVKETKEEAVSAPVSEDVSLKELPKS